MLEDRSRQQWSSRPAFIVAAVGSAVGFGNVWRFPSLAYKYGGGAFFIPYVMALVLIGIPLLMLETAIGQFYQTGDAGAFGRVNKRFRGLGLASVFSAFILVVYYCVLLGWSARMFVFSCQGSEGRWKDVKGSEAWGWFANTVTGLATVKAGSSEPTRLVGANVGALAVVWFAVFLCLAFGVKWTGRVAFITVGLPIVILIVLLVRAATLDGAGDGIREYIGQWDTTVLRTQGAVWSEAVSQIFFSLSLAMGTMTAYASYNKRESPVFSNALIIAISNSLFSFIAGFAVFAIVGYLAKKENTPIEEMRFGGPALMFGTYPVALSTLPGGGHWERLFFVALMMLGIDSAFSITEGVITVLADTALLQRLPRMAITGAVCFAGFLCGLLYCTDAGLLFLDVTDFYINFLLLMIGLLECFVVGWMYGLPEQMAAVGSVPALSLMATSLLPTILASAVWFGIGSDDSLAPIGWTTTNWALMWGFIALLLSSIVGAVVTYMVASRTVCEHEETRGLCGKEYWIELLMGNVHRLRDQLTGVVRYIPYAWFVLIRYMIPQVLIVLFVNLARSKNEDGDAQFGNYGGLSRGFQAVGIAVFSVSVAIVLVGFVAPDLYACFSISTYREEGEETGKGVKAEDFAAAPAAVESEA